MLQDNENNKSASEYSSAKEFNKDPKEDHLVSEVSIPKELSGDGEEFSTRQKINKIKSEAKTGGKFATGAAVVGVASLIVIGTSGLVNMNMDGKIESLLFQDNKIVYDVNVSDVEKGNTMFFEIYEGKASKPLTTKEILGDVKESLNGQVKGMFDIDDLNIGEKLKEVDSLTYTFHLCGNTGLVNRTYDSYVLEINQYKSEFRSISYKSDYSNSGNFLFWLDFQDDYQIFTDFEAFLVDSEGVRRDCIFTDNLHEQQSIFILDLAAGPAHFEVSFKINQEEQVISYDNVLI